MYVCCTVCNDPKGAITSPRNRISVPNAPRKWDSPIHVIVAVAVLPLFIDCLNKLAAYQSPPAKRARKMASKVDETSEIIKAFRVYQKELDFRHDKHERVVKLSRDITIESKRVIFLLQRLSGLEQDSEVLDEAEGKLAQIVKTKFFLIAKELEGEDPYQFLRAYSPGLQEYIEALSLHHYLKFRKLLELSYIESQLKFNKQTSDDEMTDESNMADKNETTLRVHIPQTEYLLGIADLTGEVMRLAINSVGAGNLETPFEVCKFLRTMLLGFSAAGYVSRDFNRKLYTLRQSLQKVESACYTLQIRGSEIPKQMLEDMLSFGPPDVHIYSDEPSTIDD